jgi:multisubunit Na+/H+ antiporter MnhB subunit
MNDFKIRTVVSIILINQFQNDTLVKGIVLIISVITTNHLEYGQFCLTYITYSGD